MTPLDVLLPRREGGGIWTAPTLASADRERVRWYGFEAFARMALPLVPKVPPRPLWNWHMSEVCTHFEALYRGHATEHVTNIPPGHIKSTLKSVLGPCWIWTQDPSFRFLCATYDDGLSAEFAAHSIAVCQSRWYVERWGEILKDDRALKVTDFATRKGGSRYSTSCPKGRGVGRHGSMYLIDDPIKPGDVRKYGGKGGLGAILEAVNGWYGESVTTRHLPGEVLRIDLTMQRLHDEDLSAHVLDTADPVYPPLHLMLPWHFEPERRCVTPFGGDRRTTEGERLWDEPAKVRNVNKAIRAMGGIDSEAAQAQFQQNPSNGKSRIFPGPFLTFDPQARKFGDTLSVISVDPTFTGDSTSDDMATEVWGYSRGDFLCYKSDAIPRGFTEAVRNVIDTRKTWRATNVLIEKSANGFALIELFEQKIAGLVAVSAHGASKVQRARAVKHHFDRGRVFFAQNEPWLPEKFRALKRFPGGAKDDSVDTTSQALIYLASEYGIDESLDALDEWTQEKALIEPMMRALMLPSGEP